ncbi:MAG: hypothetical protein WBQ95_06845 [Terracidiphilus sp.]
METRKTQGSIKTHGRGSISIHISEGQSEAGSPASFGEPLQREMKSPLPPHVLFVHAQETKVPLPERFPRLTFFAIAVALLASTLAAEFDYLHGAGYYWP